MGEHKGYTRLCGRLKQSFLNSIKETRVHEGLGAVGVLIGVSLFCVGVVFTVVNKNDKEGVTPSFGHSGPILISVSIVIIILGYVFSNVGNIARIWTYVKKRKQFPYIDYDHYYRADVNKNLFSVVCFKVIKTCFRIREGRQLTESTEFSGRNGSPIGSHGLSNSEVICETEAVRYESCRRRRSSEFRMTSRRSHSLPSVTSPLRNFKVSPYVSGSVSDSSDEIQSAETPCYATDTSAF